VSVGVVGTFITVVGATLVLYYFCGITWYRAVLVATAVAPTDPAVVFSVLGKREIAGRSGTILEGESCANDPVGISLMVGLIAAGGIFAGRDSWWRGTCTMGAGASVGGRRPEHD